MINFSFLEGIKLSNNFNVGGKIKELRVQKAMSAKELASSAGISFGMLSQLEKGSTQGSVETLRKIAKVLDVTLAFLFTNSNEEFVSNSNINTLDDEKHYVVRNNERKKNIFS